MYYEVEGMKTRILGSMHFVPKDSPVLPARVYAAYDWAEFIMMEHNNTEAFPHMVLPQGQSLTKILPFAVLRRLVPFWPTDRGLPPLAAMKPWAALMVAGASALETVPGVEPFILAKLKEVGRDFESLETGADLVSFADRVPLPQILGAFEFFFEHAADGDANLRRLHQTWLESSSEAMWKAVQNTAVVKSPELLAAMFTRRNELWARRIETTAFTNRGRVLIVVGALHLAGPGNLIELLRDRGHAVNQIG